MLHGIFTIIHVVCGFVLVALFFIICCSLLSKYVNRSSQDSEAARHDFEPNSEEIRQLNNGINVNVSIAHPTIQYENEIKPFPGFRYDKADWLARPVLPKVPEIGNGKSNNVKYNLTFATPVLPREEETGKRQLNYMKPHLLKLAIKKHIDPECNTSAEAEQFSFERNKLYPTDLNTVFRVSPTDFHGAILNEKQVILISPFLNTLGQSCLGCPV